MIQHVVLVKYKPEASDEEKKTLLSLLTSLGRHGLSKSYRFGLDMGIGRPTNANLGIVSEFADEAAFKAYLAHDAHTAVVTVLRQVAAEMNVIQFKL